MVDTKHYRAFAESAVGASHVKEGKICQDYAMCYKDDGLTIIAVADGHGSEPHIRSDRGSRFACEAAVKCIRDMANVISTLRQAQGTTGSITETTINNLTLSIVTEWRERVFEDWNNDSAATIDLFPDGCDEDALTPPVLYGTTLIAVAALPHCCFGIQIGDGKCVMIDTRGNVTQPIPWDDNCYLNFTTSLCEDDAETLFRHFMVYNTDNTQQMPAALFINTDGVDNSYTVRDNDVQLGKLYSTIAANIITQGFEKGVEELKEFLPMLTQKGSGDDVSIAGIIDMENELWRGV
jgi:hypothetical protein